VLIKHDKCSLAGLTAAIVTTAAFAKTFVPFYLIGSSAIFGAACVLGAALIIVGRRSIYAMAIKVNDLFPLLVAFYALVIINFLFLSRAAIPITYLLGIFIFHGTFLVFGFAAARAPKTVLLTLLGAAAIYSVVIIQHVARFGHLKAPGEYLHDIFGIGDPAIFFTFHQNIGIVLGLGSLAALGLAFGRTRTILAFGATLVALLLMYHIAARGALVALLGSLVFWIGANFWVRSKKLTALGAITIAVLVTGASALFYQHALHDKSESVWAAAGGAPDVIARTIREIQEPSEGLRIQIWTTAWHRISTEPDHLIFGRGVGMYPVIEGYGTPDWLLRRTEAAKHYPHNVYLEMLYETGITGLLLFTMISLFPLAIALKHWGSFSAVQKSAISMYVFQLAGSQLSGSFAFEYLDQFFFALAVGIIALKRADDVLAPDQSSTMKLNASYSR
jgi:O-antigen ligase